MKKNKKYNELCIRCKREACKQDIKNVVVKCPIFIPKDPKDRFPRIVAMLISLILFFCVLCPVWAEIPQDKAIRAIIGEASNQGFQGMLAVATGIKNRGTLKGVYGLNSKHIDKEPTWVWEQAKKAWERANMSDLEALHDGTHWENIKAFGEPSWAKKMVKVYQYKDHIFYKEKK